MNVADVANVKNVVNLLFERYVFNRIVRKCIFLYKPKPKLFENYRKNIQNSFQVFSVISSREQNNNLVEHTFLFIVQQNITHLE